MARYSQNITEDGTYLLATVNKPHNADFWVATFAAYGTWGSGTITWQFSPDGGSTLLTMKDLSGTNMTSSDDDNFNVNLGDGSTNSDAIKVYATMAGSSGANVNVVIFDNH